MTVVGLSNPAEALNNRTVCHSPEQVPLVDLHRLDLRLQVVSIYVQVVLLCLHAMQLGLQFRVAMVLGGVTPLQLTVVLLNITINGKENDNTTGGRERDVRKTNKKARTNLHLWYTYTVLIIHKVNTVT